jgi:hypothetical protein
VLLGLSLATECAGDWTLPLGVFLGTAAFAVGLLFPSRGSGGRSLSPVRPVAAGAVYVCTLGADFVDERMGMSDSTVPSDELRHHFHLEYGILQGIAEDDVPGALADHGSRVKFAPEAGEGSESAEPEDRKDPPEEDRAGEGD